MKNLLFILLFASSTGFGQKPMYLSAELAGSGGVGSVNFETTVLLRDPVDLVFRAGLSFAPIDKNNGTAVIFPLMLHVLIGNADHKADIGLGQSFSVTTRGSLFARMPFSVGYRFEPVEKRYYLRAAYTPIISYLFNFQWEHWGGLTFGYRITK